ncbi:hypothetical protein ACFQGT_02845 [Natrialbaceae archaeon GCM10025810]|uniref:hypothetical protein n=1 Tax=Halovalidus salilacus TaxID=3075124 RepID=UPI00361BB0D1
MNPTFTEDDVGKTVENADGTDVGTVTEVEGDTARVEAEPGLVDSIKATLGWEADADEQFTLSADSVREIGAERITLESEFTDRSERREEPGATPESEAERDPERSDDDRIAGDEGRRIDERTVRDERPERERESDLDPGLTSDADDRPVNEREGVPEGEAERTEEMESVEREARGLEVDPTELTDDDPEAELRPREDVGERTDAAVEPDDGRRTDVEIEPAGRERRTDAEVDRAAIADAEEATSETDREPAAEPDAEMGTDRETPPGPTTEDATRTELEGEDEDVAESEREDESATGGEPSVDDSDVDADEALETQAEETRSRDADDDAETNAEERTDDGGR